MDIQKYRETRRIDEQRENVKTGHISPAKLTICCRRSESDLQSRICGAVEGEQVPRLSEWNLVEEETRRTHDF